MPVNPEERDNPETRGPDMEVNDTNTVSIYTQRSCLHLVTSCVFTDWIAICFLSVGILDIVRNTDTRGRSWESKTRVTFS